MVAFHHHEGLYAEFFPHWLLNTFFPFFTGLAFIVAGLGVVRHWKAMREADEAAGAYVVALGIIASGLLTLKALLLHEKFASCEAQAPRRLAHLTVFYGFMALYVVTIWAVIDIYAMPLIGVESLYPFDLIHPMKILANVGGVLLIFGCVKALLARRGTEPGSSASTSFDWIFLWALLGVGITGFAAEILRFTVDAQAESSLTAVAYSVYFVHLVLIFQLLVYLPYSKFAHVLYRVVAMVYAEHTGRHRPAIAAPAATEALEAAPAPEVVVAS